MVKTFVVVVPEFSSCASSGCACTVVPRSAIQSCRLALSPVARLS